MREQEGDESQWLLERRASASVGGHTAAALGYQQHRQNQWGIAARFSVALVASVLVVTALLSARSAVKNDGSESTFGSSRSSNSPSSTGFNADPNPSVYRKSETKTSVFTSTVGEGDALFEKDGIARRGGGTVDVGGGNVEERPPNVIFVLIDDVGMNDMGVESTDLALVTPFMDSLASEGVRIAKHYSYQFCTPARAALMTGRYTFLTGMQFGEIQSSHKWGLPLEEVTLGDRFKAAGYATHMVGKWNLGMYTEDHYPFNRGFDTFLGYMGAQETYYSHSNGEWKDFGYGDADGYVNSETNTTRWGPELTGVYSTSLTADRAINVATEHQASGTEDPLFLYLAFQAAHFPLDTPALWMFTDEQLEIFHQLSVDIDVRLMFAKIMFYLDLQLKRMVEELDAIGMMDNTLLVLASDNGGCPTNGGSNFPFRGFKSTLFEGGVRTPALVYSKSESIIPAEARGTTYDGMMHVTDWTSTLANVTGIPTDEMGQPLSGLDHWSAIIGKRPESSPVVRNELVVGFNSYIVEDGETSVSKGHQPRGGYIYDGWKIVVGDKCAGWFSFHRADKLSVDTTCPGGSCPTCDKACMYTNSDINKFLFHLDTDPYEEVNLITTMPDKFAEMSERWAEACKGEVHSEYEAHDPRSQEKWESFNNWMVAWL